MTILGRYLGTTVIKAILLVLLVFIGLETFILLVTQISALGKGSYHFGEALLYVLLLLPQQTYALFPMAGLLGMLLGLNLLANHSELIVMRAAGVAPAQIARHALIAGLALVIAMTLIGEWLAPAAKHLAERRKTLAISSGQALKIPQGLWLIQGPNFYSVRTIYSLHHIAGISRYAFNNQHQLLSASFAEQGHYQHGAWQMYNIRQSNIHQDQITVTAIPHAVWNLAINPHLLKISLSQPEEMSLKQLADFMRYQKNNHLDTGNYQIIFWQRLLQPLASLLMMFLAIPFIFGPLRSVTTSLRLMVGVLTGFAFYLSSQLLPALSQKWGFPPFLAVILPVLLFAAAGMVLLRRV